ARRAPAAIGVGLDYAGIDGKAFATDQSLLHAARDHALEHLPKRIALTEAAVTVLREGRMVRYRVFQAKSTEPAISQIEMDLFAQSARLQHEFHPRLSTHPVKSLPCRAASLA